MAINFGGGMIFPNSYGRDEFSREEELRQDAEQAAADAQAECEFWDDFGDTGSWRDRTPDPDLVTEAQEWTVRSDFGEFPQDDGVCPF